MKLISPWRPHLLACINEYTSVPGVIGCPDIGGAVAVVGGGAAMGVVAKATLVGSTIILVDVGTGNVDDKSGPAIASKHAVEW